MCLNCRRPVVHATYRETGGWEPDYDPSEDKATWRHLNGYAACMGDLWATPRPEVVTLCGSTRFKDQYTSETRRLTLQGIIVVSVGLFGWDEGRPEDVLGEDVKAGLDELHKRKIDLADRIHVINVDGYVGSSTRSEIEYATAKGKAVTYYAPALIDGRDDG